MDMMSIMCRLNTLRCDPQLLRRPAGAKRFESNVLSRGPERPSQSARAATRERECFHRTTKHLLCAFSIAALTLAAGCHGGAGNVGINAEEVPDGAPASGDSGDDGTVSPPGGGGGGGGGDAGPTDAPDTPPAGGDDGDAAPTDAPDTPPAGDGDAGPTDAPDTPPSGGDDGDAAPTDAPDTPPAGGDDDDAAPTDAPDNPPAGGDAGTVSPFDVPGSPPDGGGGGDAGPTDAPDTPPAGGDDGEANPPEVPDSPPLPSGPITVQTPFALSDGISGDKPKIQRLGDDTLVVVYGDSPVGVAWAYDVKAAEERPARDIFVKTCKPGAAKTCDRLSDWSAAVNVSQSAGKFSTGVFDWRGTLGDPSPYPGDVDKANIKANGPMIVLTWISKYCPDGDLAAAGIQPSAQRAILYVERDNRVIPFSCVWTSYSTDKGASWSAPIQLNTGVRDAIMDSSRGNINTDPASASHKKGQIGISWQEDPQGLQLGEGDGPGDGASGAKTGGGTDIWYTYATVDLSVPGTPADDFVLQPAVRLTNNWDGAYGIHGAADGGHGAPNYIYDGAGAVVQPKTLETGQAAASRPNIAMVGTTTIIAYEETKQAAIKHSGKFIRYHAFPFNAPPATAEGKAGCILSDPAKNGRRVRLLTQSPTEAGAAGIQVVVLWKEGLYTNGGPSDIVVRRGMGGLQPANLVPAVDTAVCETSDYAKATTLTSERAENVSSQTPVATTANLTDDTELNAIENTMAHRGVLRGRDLWIGYIYTSDVVQLAAQADNYNFWIRKFNVDADTWSNPQNVTNIADKGINVREPRMFATPKTNDTLCPTSPAFCRNPEVIYLAWGTQTNVAAPEDLGEHITASLDSAETFFAPVKLSLVQGVLWGDDESASEAQLVTRPDGTRFYAVWTQKNLTTLATKAQFASGYVAAAPAEEGPRK